MEKPDGTLWDGADGFVIRTGDVTAIRMDLILLAPVATAIALFVVLSISGYKRLRGLQNCPWALRAILLSATQLFRLFDMEVSKSAWYVQSTKGLMPDLKSSESEIPELEAVWDKTGARIKARAGTPLAYNEEPSASVELLRQVGTEH